MLALLIGLCQVPYDVQILLKLALKEISFCQIILGPLKGNLYSQLILNFSNPSYDLIYPSNFQISDGLIVSGFPKTWTYFVL